MRDGEIDVLEITRRGKPVLAVMPWELYERMERVYGTASRLELEHGRISGEGANSGALLEFLRNNRLPATIRLSAEEIDNQILDEREAWE